MAASRGAAPRGSRLRVALAQMEPALGDLQKNIATHAKLARQALKKGAGLVVFPELSLTGYRLQDLVSEVAVRIDASGPLRPLFDLSRRVALAIGLVEESDGHRFYNSALFLEGGRVRHLHRKVHLPTYGMFEEGRYFAPGDSLRAFRTRRGRMGMLVCEDLWHPATALVLAQDGADYLMVLSSGPTRGLEDPHQLMSQETWCDLLKVTAQLQTTYVIWTNRVGFEDGVNFGGGSRVIDPLGRTIAQAPLFEERLLVCDLDRASLRRARTLFPLLRDERLPLVQREVARLIAAGGGADDPPRGGS